MRLIDKDRLLKGSNHYWLEMENFGDIEAIDVRFIEMAEEIKAIPIEWIKKKLLSCQYEYENDYDKGFDKGWNCAIKTLLKDWEKENADTN